MLIRPITQRCFALIALCVGMSAHGATSLDLKTSQQILMSQGEGYYNTYCAACHQKDGSGMPLDAPALKKGTPASSYITIDKPASNHIDLVLKGIAGTAMIGYGNLLSNEVLAAIITYERNAWGNNTGDIIQPGDIEIERQRLKNLQNEPDKTMTLQELMQRGALVYRTRCARCHQLDGSGKAPNGPSLLTSWVAKDRELISHKISLILKGAAGTRMRSYAQQLNNNEIAAVATYIANAWHNQGGQIIQPSLVLKERVALMKPIDAAKENKKWSLAQLMELGRITYKSNCIRCHQEDGRAVPARGVPALKGSAIATQKPFTKHIDTVLTGIAGSIMRAFGPRLTDLEIAAVVTYERNAFGNNTQDVVEPYDVAPERKRLAAVIEYQKTHQLQQQFERDEKNQNAHE